MHVVDVGELAPIGWSIKIKSERFFGFLSPMCKLTLGRSHVTNYHTYLHSRPQPSPDLRHILRSRIAQSIEILPLGMGRPSERTPQRTKRAVYYSSDPHVSSNMFRTVY